MTYQDWCALAGIPTPPESWNRHGVAAMQIGPATLLPSTGQMEAIASRLALPQAQTAQLLEIRAAIEASPLLLSLFNLWHLVFFLEKDASAEAYSPWPLPAGMSNENAALFRSLVIFSGSGHLEAALSGRNLSAFLPACLENYRASTQKHFDRHGVYGLENSEMWWLWPVFLGRVFRLGRLNYEIGFYASSYRVYQQGNGPLLLMAADTGQRYDESGHESETGLYHPGFIETETHVTGYGFTKTGHFDPTRLTLPFPEWHPAVQSGDPILALHIPPEGKLDPDLVDDSLRQAIPFFQQHFPDLLFRLFTCHSWLLNTELSSLLAPGSNILTFQSRFSIALANRDEDALYSFIFQVPTCPVEQLIPKTGFHERVLSFVKEGGLLWDGFGVFPFPER